MKPSERESCHFIGFLCSPFDRSSSVEMTSSRSLKLFCFLRYEVPNVLLSERADLTVDQCVHFSHPQTKIIGLSLPAIQHFDGFIIVRENWLDAE